METNIMENNLITISCFCLDITASYIGMECTLILPHAFFDTCRALSIHFNGGNRSSHTKYLCAHGDFLPPLQQTRMKCLP